MNPIELKNLTGCGLSMCKDALKYSDEHGGGDDMAIAYLKAKCCAVKTTCSFDERVMMFYETDNL